MAVIGTFGSFTAARMGIYASQASLNVTGNNIANINTKGYTRQRMDLVSLYSYGDARYANRFNTNIGYGVLTDGVSQLRDPFLDIRYRDEQAHVGYYEAMVNGLQQISNVLDEVGKGKGEFGILERQFNDFLQQLQNLNNRVNDQEYDTTVRSSAESLVNFFHDYSEALTRVRDNQLADLKSDVTTVNTTLDKIRELNVQIRNAGIYGDQALELRDQRNVLIDKLSSYIKIDVRYDEEKLDEFSSVERINITLADSGTPPVNLVQGIYSTHLVMDEKTADRNPEYEPDNPVGMQYISRETDLTAKPPRIVYTNKEQDAMLRQNGALLKNAPQDWKDLAARDGVDYDTLKLTPYDADASEGKKYLDENGDPTNDLAKAKQINNAVKGADDNRLWMSFEPLKDMKGRLMKDQYGREITEGVDLGDNDLYGSLQAKRELLTEEGEFASEVDIAFDPQANIKRGIPYYQRALDALARQFAEAFNKANTTEDGEPVFQGYATAIGSDGIERYKMDTNCDLYTGDSDDAKAVIAAIAKEKEISDDEAKDYLMRKDVTDLSKELQKSLEELQGKHLGGDLKHGEAIMGGGILFSVSGDGNVTEVTDPDTGKTTGITAANISIAKDWAVGSVRILSTKNYNFLDNSTANDNIYHMIELMAEKMDYTANNIKDIVSDAKDGDEPYFKGSFQERLADINTILATRQETCAIEYDSYELTSLNLENQRQSVSGVDLNDEATNMMVFQKSYAAACQLMTTLDSMLDKLINGTIR